MAFRLRCSVELDDTAVVVVDDEVVFSIDVIVFNETVKLLSSSSWPLLIDSAVRRRCGRAGGFRSSNDEFCRGGSSRAGLTTGLTTTSSSSDSESEPWMTIISDVESSLLSVMLSGAESLLLVMLSGAEAIVVALATVVLV